MADAAAPDSGKRMNVKLIAGAVFAVINLVVSGGGAYLVYASTIGYEAPSVREEELAKVRQLASESGNSESDVPLIYTLEKMTVNLSGEPKRLMQIEVNLEMLNKEGFEEVMDIERRAKVRDSVMTMLAEQTFADVEPIQGKLFLKDRIARKLNSMLDQGIVKNVFFSEFVVQ